MNKLAFALSLALLAPASIAFAETNVGATVGVTLHGDAGAGQDENQDDNRGATIGASTSAAVHLDNEDAQKGSDEESGDTSTSSESEHNAGLSGEHRSAVAAFVHSLLEDANRDGGIGEDVRAVAESQSESASTTADAIAHVESRSKVWAFLFGTDWKNIGTLRSEIARTDANIVRLTAILASTTDASVKADLQAQITALTAEQAKVKAFADENEKSFSLFGWFTKLFASSSASTSIGATTTASSQ